MRNQNIHDGGNVNVARDWRGTVVSAISKKFNTTFLLQEEAEAIVWANQLVVDMDLVMAWYVKLVYLLVAKFMLQYDIMLIKKNVSSYVIRYIYLISLVDSFCYMVNLNYWVG